MNEMIESYRCPKCSQGMRIPAIKIVADHRLGKNVLVCTRCGEQIGPHQK